MGSKWGHSEQKPWNIEENKLSVERVITLDLSIPPSDVSSEGDFTSSHPVVTWEADEERLCQDKSRASMKPRPQA